MTLSAKIITAAMLYCFAATSGMAACRHALVLALDISGSVNDEEYLLQIEGVASSLQSPLVRDLILSQPNAPISLVVFEWSSEKHQKIIQNWIEITTQSQLDLVAHNIRNHRKDRTTLKTAIGSAVRFAKALLDQKPDCWRHTVDVSGDGYNNDGLSPNETYAAMNFDGITINGLVVTVAPTNAVENPVFQFQSDLKDYFDTDVIHGPDAFAMRALGYWDYERAMKEKLIKELSPAAVSQVSPNKKSRHKPL